MLCAAIFGCSSKTPPAATEPEPPPFKSQAYVTPNKQEPKQVAKAAVETPIVAKKAEVEPPPKKTDDPNIVSKKEVEPVKKTEKKEDKSWINDAEAELAAAKKLVPEREPFKPVRMTMAEWEVASMRAQFWMNAMKLDDPGSVRLPPWGILSLDYDVAAPTIPRIIACWEREALLQIAMTQPTRAIEALVIGTPKIRPLVDPEFKKKMLARLPWKERKELFAKFVAATGGGSDRKWSMIDPFDDLDGDEMRAAIDAGLMVKNDGLRKLSRSQRLLILRAGALDFFENRLDSSR